MQEKIELSDQEFGRALVDFIGLSHGQRFFPFRIIRCSFVPNQRVTIGVADKPQVKEKIEKTEADNFFPGVNDVLSLSKEDVHHALSYYVCNHKMHVAYGGDIIERIDQEIPPTISCVLKYITRGSKLEAGRCAFEPL